MVEPKIKKIYNQEEITENKITNVKLTNLDFISNIITEEFQFNECIFQNVSFKELKNYE